MYKYKEYFLDYGVLLRMREQGLLLWQVMEISLFSCLIRIFNIKEYYVLCLDLILVV